MATIEQLGQEIEAIKERNKRVEGDKAWEDSWTRKIIIAFLTYVVVSLFFTFANFPNPWISSIVPSIAFILSTLSLSIFKDFWMKNIYKK